MKEPEGEKLNNKVLAEGYHPKQENMKVDFVEEANSLEQAVKKLKIKIDRYLTEHQLKSLNPPNNY